MSARSMKARSFASMWSFTNFSVMRSARGPVPNLSCSVRLRGRLRPPRRGPFVPRAVLPEALGRHGLRAAPDLTLTVLVPRARHALGDPALILTGPGGYSFAAGEACSVDAETFLDRVRAGRSLLAAGSATAALRALEEALDLWTGEPLAEDAYD